MGASVGIFRRKQNDAGTCPTCGRPLDAHDRQVRFRLPDPVLALPDQERTEGTWLSDADANGSVMMQVPDLGAFVRVLLPVHLSGGYSVTFGTWLGVDPAELRRAASIWWKPEYAGLELDGRLANALPGWGLLAAPAHAAVVDPDATPYIISSTDHEFNHVLLDEWPHEDILDRLP
jgi:hypothetical protein